MEKCEKSYCADFSHGYLCRRQHKYLFIAEPNKIGLAIPPALKCLQNED